MAERINVSTRLTEVYRKIEPASGSEYFPFADSKGKEYILFTAADGSIGYYSEEATGFVPPIRSTPVERSRRFAECPCV